MPQGSDEKWIKNADSVHKKSKPYVVPKPRRDPLAFTVKHYAGTVDYTAKEFLQRNKDPLHDDLALAMNESSSKLLRCLFECDERTLKNNYSSAHCITNTIQFRYGRTKTDRLREISQESSQTDEDARDYVSLLHSMCEAKSCQASGHVRCTSVYRTASKCWCVRSGGDT